VKKKISTLLVFLFCFLAIFTGCNLFSANASSNLESVVASSGDIEITREQLINAYNSTGYYYNQYYGYTMEEAIKKTIDELIGREYLLRYIDSESQNDKQLRLTSAEEYAVITETWEYIDSTINSYAEQVKKELGINVENSTDSSSTSDNEYKGYSPYVSKFRYVANDGEDGGNIVKIFEEENTYTPAYNSSTKYQYKINLGSKNKDLEKIVWNRYITSLKRNQDASKFSDNSDAAIFNRQIDKIYQSNLENAKIKKFEEVYSSRFGVDFNEDLDCYVLNDTTKQQIIDAYSNVYNKNKNEYDIYLKNKEKNANIIKSYYEKLADTSKRENYFYYGEDEAMLTCIHILIKFSDEQTSSIDNAKNDQLLKNNLDAVLSDLKSQSNTKAYERNPQTGDAVDSNGIGVDEMFSMLLNEIRHLQTHSSSEEYIDAVTEVFNKYLYTYGMDTGIMNAKFDYVVGSKNSSSMVESFTEVVRKLYNDGNAVYSPVTLTAEYNSDVELYFPNGIGYTGAISAPFLEEASNYSGYHIVLFTGTLKNIPSEIITVNNIFETLGKAKTSVSYNETLLEYFYDKISKDNYNEYQSNIVTTLKNNNGGIAYNSKNFADLY